VTVHREQIMKKEDQQDAAIRCLLLTSVSTCFGHHYAHLQENKGTGTASGVLFWFCWMWLVAVVERCLVGCPSIQLDAYY
jgi:glycerol-3-phosphate acyltransferase PlsY